ncbi:MAG: hypothetical protein KY434_11225 [Actinobacteria bacterium]|nr:hypothetical protein [Actinomycetota bacterium]
MLGPLEALQSPSCATGHTPDPATTAAALEARELRLLACAVGDHLPVELADEVARLRGHRRALLEHRTPAC